MADKKKTDRQTNQQINTHYSFIGIDFLCFSLIELSSSFVIQGRDGPGFLLEGSLMGGAEQCIVVSCRTVFLQFVHS